MLKIFLLCLLNFILIPIYILFFLICCILAFVPIFPTKTCKNNFKNQLHLKGAKLYFYICLVYLNYTFYFFEIIIFTPLQLTKFSFEKNFSLVKALKKAKKLYPQTKNTGYLYLLSHMGNIEMYAVAIAQANKILNKSFVYGLAKPTKNKFLNKLLAWYRRLPGIDTFWTDKRLLSNMQQVIQNGHSIAMLVDQKPAQNGLFLKFFNEFASFPTAGLRFCMSKNMIVFYISAHRILPGWAKFKFYCGRNVHLEPQSEHDKKELQIYSLTQADIWKKENILKKDMLASLEMSYFVAWIENEINKHPTQWSWDYKKWSRKPT